MFGSNRLNRFQKSRKECSFDFAVGCSCFVTVPVVCSTNHEWPGRITLPEWSMALVNNLHFFSVWVALTLYSSHVTHETSTTWSTGDIEMTMISCRYTTESCQRTEVRITSITLCNVAGALHSPNDILMNLHNTWWEVNAVLLRLCSSISIC